MKKIISLMLVSLLVILPTGAFCDELEDLVASLQKQKTITVTGAVTLWAEPDQADLHMVVESYETQFPAAVEKNRETIQRVTDAMSEMGMGTARVYTTKREVETVYSIPENATTPPRIRGYKVIQSITVQASDVSMIGELVAKAVAAGVTKFDGAVFGYSDSQTLYDNAVKMAIQDATRKAEMMAAMNNASVGEVIQLVENQQQGANKDAYPGPSRLLIAAGAGGENGDQLVDLLTEGQSFSANVTMVFKLN